MSNYQILPSLKRPNGKTQVKKWVHELAMFVSNNMSIYTSTSIRATVRDKIVNLDLYNNKIHAEDFISLLNPLDLKTIEGTREIQHFPISTSLFDLLVGEEIDRPFEPIVDITNNIGIEEKKERLKGFVKAKLKELEENFQEDEQELKQEIKKLTRYLKYTYKDIKEKKASALLDEYYESLQIEQKFLEGFRGVWCTGDEAYSIDIIHNEPTFEVVNTSNIRLYGGGRSPKFEDYDLIVEEDHRSPGYLIDRYGEELSNDEVDRILTYQTRNNNFDKPFGNVTHEFIPVGDILGTEISDNFIDDTGCMRHMRVRAKAYKQVKKVIYQDPATGTEQIKIVSNRYSLREGEALKETVWITEWWIFTLIGADIIVDAHPIPIRYNRLSSLAEGHPGIVGRVYNINERQAVPPMSRIRVYQYLYDVVLDRVIVAMSKNVGPILDMDFAKKPAKWGTLKWLGYMFNYNVKFVDSFKEVAKGSASGQLAGNLASGRDQMQNFDFSSYIQQLVSMAEYLEKAMADALGIVPQRLGAVSNRETVGGIERATSQSSHITEWYFYTHEKTKIEALNVFIEAAKTALKDNPKKLKYVLDKDILEILDITEDDLAGVDLGVKVTNSKKSQEYKQMLNQAAFAFMQNGGEFSFIFDILNSNSMAEKRRMIEEYENDKREELNEQRQFESKNAQDILKAEALEKEKDRLANQAVEDARNAVKVKLKELDVLMAAGELKLNATNSLTEMQQKIKEFQETMEQNDAENKLKKEELRIKEKAVDKKTTAVSTN